MQFWVQFYSTITLIYVTEAALGVGSVPVNSLLTQMLQFYTFVIHLNSWLTIIHIDTDGATRGFHVWNEAVAGS